MEFLSIELALASADMSILPMKRSNTSPTTHILFADDVLLFCKGHKKSMSGVKAVLQSLQYCAGLVVNLDKSRIFLSKGVRNKAAIAEVLGVKLSSLPIKYLGLPLSSAYPKARHFAPLVDSCKRRIEHWGAKILSSAGKLQLISSVLHNTISFWIQSFKLPLSTIRQLESLFANFFWGSRFHALSWDKVCKPKKEGGLGLRRIAEINIAAGAKLLWTVISNPESIWASYMRSRYLKSTDITTVGSSVVDSGSWKFILLARNALPQATIQVHQGSASWPTPSARPRLSFFWDLIRKRNPPFALHSTIWFANHCPKMSTCLWRAANNSLMTKEFMLFRTISTDNICTLCKGIGESSEHLFFNCEYSAYIWSLCRLKLGLTQKSQYNLLEEMELLKAKFKKRSGVKLLARLAIPTTVWHIWRERNNRIFQGKEKTKIALVQEIIATISILWIADGSSSEGSKILENWL